MYKLRTKRSHLEALMDVIFGNDWHSIYILDKDMLGYKIMRKDGKHTCLSERFHSREMYVYLSGMRDLLNEKKQL